MARSVARPDARDGEKRRERLERIAREAAKQCRRARPAEVDAPLDWPRALERMAGHELLIVPWEGAGSLRMGERRAECPGAKDIAIAVGPEGGISEEEVAALRAHGARVVTLGPRILRAETAVVASAALAMALWGDL